MLKKGFSSTGFYCNVRKRKTPRENIEFHFYLYFLCCEEEKGKKLFRGKCGDLSGKLSVSFGRICEKRGRCERGNFDVIFLDWEILPKNRFSEGRFFG